MNLSRLSVPGAVLAAMLFLSVLPASASSPNDAILVLDASGSMWGQIDGLNKIVIAKDVVEGLVLGLPPEQRLGLVAYGHRREGDCSDIETLAGVGAERADMVAALRELTPHGKTPLAKSVEHAALTLDYRKRAASVIVVSDGLETCDADPCALARMLEQNGLDFTVHVVGFDVTVEERAGLQCMADETGGTFVAAASASELASALRTLAEAGPAAGDVEGDAVPSTLAMKATVLPGGPLIQSQLEWTVTALAGGETVFSATDTGSAMTEVLPGEYVAEARWRGWQDGREVKTGRLQFTVEAQQPKVITVPVDLGFKVSLQTPAVTREGVPFDVTWSGPDELGAYLHVASPEDGPREPIYFFAAMPTRTKAGVSDASQPLTASLAAPSTEGVYEVRYVLDQPRLILARNALRVTDGGFTVSAPAEVPVSSVFSVAWAGEATPGDFVTIVEAGSAAAFARGYTSPLREDGSAELTAPPQPGEYEVRYVLANGYTLYPGMQHAVQATTPVSVVPVVAGIAGPATAVGGSSVPVSVTLPPDWEDDYISIAAPGATRANPDARVTLGRAGAGDGKLQLQAPNIAGDYELVYFLSPGNAVLARQPITITRADAAVRAPEQVVMGDSFDIAWSGPGYRGDRVVIAPVDVPDEKMWGWGARYGFIVPTGETEGTGSVRQYPFEAPGVYSARYVTGLQHQVLATDTFTVVAAPEGVSSP